MGPEIRDIVPLLPESVAQFEALVELIPEPKATMVYVAMGTALRVSELAALSGTISSPTRSRWNAATVAEGGVAPKTSGSAGRIADRKRAKEG